MNVPFRRPMQRKRCGLRPAAVRRVANSHASGVLPAQVGYQQCIETCRRQFPDPAEFSDCIRRRCW
jgi:hypothetical protein